MKRLLGAAGLSLSLAGPVSAAPTTVTATMYRWKLEDGSTAADASVTHVYAPGTWTAGVTATSATGETSHAAVLVQAAAEAIALRRPGAERWDDAVKVTLRGRVASRRTGQRLHGLAPTGRTDARLWRLLTRARTPSARYPVTHLQVDKSR